MLDSEGGHYESSYINVEKGKFEGQLVIGDSFVNPVKDFTIEKNDVIVLQLELTPCTCKARGPVASSLSPPPPPPPKKKKLGALDT